MVCVCIQLDDECELSSTLEADDEDDGSHIALKIIAAAVFFVEVIVGGMVPLIVGHFEKLATWLSLLNSFSGGIFMGAGKYCYRCLIIAASNL